MLPLLISLRPKQWLKNLFVMTPLMFSKQLLDGDSLVASLTAFLVFCLLSGGVYLFNDLKDLQKDQIHPTKRKRPIAAGTLSIRLAGFVACVLIFLGISIASTLGTKFLTIAASYVALQVAYSLYLKDIVLIDVGTIALGFILRVAAGAEAVGVQVSAWLFSCTILLALFLGLTKRRKELQYADPEALSRKVLNDYNPTMLDLMIAMIGSATLISYALYTRDPETIERAGTHDLPYTLPFVLYGILRYLFLVYRNDDDCRLEGPDQFLTDRSLMLNIIAWGVSMVGLLYLR
jgi:4-hydroxybenzoate polyprenyltransferase